MVRSASASTSFFYEGVPTTSNPVSPNSNVVVNVYLVEVDTASSPSVIAAAGGMFSAAALANVNLTTSSGNATVVGVNVNSATEPNGFTGNNTVGIYKNGTTITQTPGSSTTATSAQGGNSGTLVGITNNLATVPPGPSGTTTGGSVTTVGTTTTAMVFLGSVTIALGGGLGHQ